MMLHVTDADIGRAERLLLPQGCTFNKERRDFIKCMQSRDVVACPGSGKTTALLAKLLILASYMPFSNGRGICVLTHTNVAIDEIKQRAGGAADALFVHPNFFGTIQAFVNRFLAIPAYRNLYRQPIHAIDNDHFFAAIRARYERDIGLQQWLEPRGGVGALGRYWFRPDDLTIGKDMDNDIPKLSRDKPTYERIERLRRAVLGQGVLSYNDAYSLALHYLGRFPAIAGGLQHRFAFVFIDEMQDTDDHQIRVLNNLFNCDTVILQRLGDPNQAIYESKVRKDMRWSPTQPILPFSDSLRYGETIAKVLDTVRVDRRLSLQPNPERQSLPPHMIVCDGGHEREVLPAFAALIREYSLHETEAPSFKAVGWVGKDKTDERKVCVRYYHPEYQKSLSRKSRWFGTLLSYVEAMDMSVRDTPQNAGALFDLALGGVVHALRMAGLLHPKTGRPFTIAAFKRHLKETNDGLNATLRQSLAKWLLAFRQRIMTVDQMRDAASAFVRTHFVDVETPELKDFLDSDSVDFEPAKKACANTFVSDAGDVIKVGTVHSVKGETHTATLYLETFNYKLDSKRLLPFCLGKYPTADAMKAQHRANLKVAHVAFSRPTHLLAFACCSENVAGQETEFEDAGWVVCKI